MPELRHAFAHIAPLFVASVDKHNHYSLDRLLEHFTADREMMLIAIDGDGKIRGAALGYRAGPEAAKLQALAVDPALRRLGIGTRLMRELEHQAQQAGCTSIHLGAEEPARPFYTALGYHGRRSVLSKSLAGAALATPVEARRKRLAALREARAQRTTRQPIPDNSDPTP
ncbi:MAG TPA: GNAT family N-acetyltransferase [Microlunatus sp.]